MATKVILWCIWNHCIADIWTKDEVVALWNQFKPSNKIFLLTVPRLFVDHLCYFCLVLLYFCARLFIGALWSSAGKGLTSWLSFVMSYCEVVTFPLVSWVSCGAWLYRFLIFALFLTFIDLYNTRAVNFLWKPARTCEIWFFKMPYIVLSK